MAWREKFGINVALIERGTRLLQVPGPEERIFPADRIAVIGTDAQLQSFGQLIEQARQQVPADRQESIGLMQFLVKNNSPLAGKSIRESGIRERGKGLVVGVERNGERQLNPDSSFIFQPEDLVWIAGNKDAIHSFS
jgi:CPA2 family monovalent cation:H+ antiporter-2